MSLRAERQSKQTLFNRVHFWSHFGITKMPGKHCSHSNCVSNSRKNPEIKFALFVQPHKDLKRAKRWVHLCGRKFFSVKNIKRWTFICEKHFPIGANLNYKQNEALEPYPAFGTKLFVFVG